MIKKEKKDWKVRSYSEEDLKKISELESCLGIKKLTAACLVNRGFDEPEKAYKFLNPCRNDFHDPLLLKGVGKAIERILLAIKQREKILIWGDYDVDGTTGTVVLRKVFRWIGFDTEFYVPHRVKEGYGINCEGIKRAKEKGVGLIISVDTGSTAFEAARFAKEQGIELIITDHHILQGECPPVYAFINPHQQGCLYPNKNLSGVGVAFKLAHALLKRLEVSDLDKKIDEILELVALGTIADVVELTGENRVIVAYGLRNLKDTKCVGFRALIDVAGCNEELDSLSVGFQIAPRINAAGRLDDASVIVELLETSDPKTAEKIAKELSCKNEQRQSIQQACFEKACIEVEKRMKNDGVPDVIVVFSEEWPVGIVGLVASKLVEKYNRPVMVGTMENGKARFSARSFSSFNVKRALDECADLLEKYGGHPKAAGFEIRADKISALENRLIGYAKENPFDQFPKINIEATAKDSSLDLRLLEEMKQMEPFGEGNPKPVFITRCLKVEEVRVMKEKHLKLKLVGQDRLLDAVVWNGFERQSDIKKGTRYDLVYRVRENNWNGLRSVQLEVEDLRPSLKKL